MTDREVMKMALERLTMWLEDFPNTAVIEDRWAVEALRQALAQPEQRAAWQGNGGAGYNVGGTGVAKPEQEPVRWFQQFGDAPPKREWVGLTDEEIDYIFGLAYADDMELLRTIEAKLKDKNG